MDKAKSRLYFGHTILVVLSLILSVMVLWPGPSYPQWIADGPKSWHNDQGDQHYAAGIKHRPNNYQVDDSTWAPIDPDWVVLNDTIHKVDAGVYHAYAMDNGFCYYVQPRNGVRHAIGIKLIQLIKFDKSDSSYQTLATADYSGEPAVNGRFLEYQDIFYGINRRVDYENILLSDRVEFTQDARDSLANLGPWAGYLLGTVSRIDLDSLNLDWHSTAGQFILSELGLMSDGEFVLKKNDTGVVWLPPQYMMCDSIQTSPEKLSGDVKIIKRIVLIGGNAFVVELFDPIPTVSFPDGSIYHNLSFGKTSTSGTAGIDLEDYIVSGWSDADGSYHIDETTGYADSMRAYLQGTWEDHEVQLALYEHTYYNPLIDTTIQVTVPCATGTCSWNWVGFPFGSSVALDLSHGNYRMAMWAEHATGEGGSELRGLFYTGNTTDDSLGFLNAIYYNSWPDPLGGAYYNNDGCVIECYYTIPSAGSKRRRIQHMGGIPNETNTLMGCGFNLCDDLSCFCGIPWRTHDE